ncbi:MAG: helix-turn-helix transcriptional regulator [Lachnospiraceae bacterium]|nr:helix-turn-helix transcriptional regulator [Lachnospiraceae bacterium]
MKISIGKKIKELRGRDGRTQEDLARALGVTGQAISRWEANGGYPDMEMVPAIANYFHVTIDELFGYHGDRETRIQDIADKAGAKLRAMGGFLGEGGDDLTGTVEMLYAALEEFPNEPELMLKLAEALFYLGWQKDEEDGKKLCLQEALQVYDKLLTMELPVKYREASLLMMIHVCNYLGKQEKAKALANEQPSIIFCKEVLLPLATEAGEAKQYQGELILVLLRELSGVISRAVLTNPLVSSDKYAGEILRSLLRLFETVFPDGRCGKEHFDLRYLYLTLATLEARHGKDLSLALAYFDKGFEHHKEYCRILAMGDYSYSAPLLSNVTIPIEKFQQTPEHFWKSQMSQMPEVLCEELRKNEKYGECFV